MKYKVYTKIISLFLAILFVFSTGAVFVFAAETDVPEFENIGETDVISDLERMGIDITEYQKDLDAEHCRMLYFLEYGYDYYASDADYGLYVYVWNPTGVAINTSTGMNSIELQISPTANVDRDGLGFLKYKLELCSYSTLQGYEHVFYKFKVADAKSFLKYLNRDLRNYDISGIELQHSGNAKPTDYAVGGVYSFSGYMPYHNASRAVKNTLNVNVTDRVTLEIELHPTSWLSEQSDKGDDYKYELFSVYFSIPNDIIRDYGNTADEITKGLVEINGVYDKHRINGIITDSTQMYNIVYPYLDREVIDVDSTVPFSFHEDEIQLLSYEWTFNQGNLFKPTINRLTSVLLSTEDFDLMTHSQILTQLETIWDDYGAIDYDDLSKLQGDNILYTIKSGNDLAYQIKNYASGNSWWDAVFDGNFGAYNKPVNYEGAMSIQALDSSSFIMGSVAMTDSAASAEYFIHDSDVSSLKSFVASEESKDKTTYLMRLSVEDYVCVPIELYSDPLDLTDGGQYYYEKVIYTDIDIFSFTFENEYSQRVIIPVVASPIDNAGVIERPQDDSFNFWDLFASDEDDLKELMKLLALLAGILIFGLVLIVISRITGLSVADIIRWLWRSIRKFARWIYKGIRKFVRWLRGLFKSSGKRKKGKKK